MKKLSAKLLMALLLISFTTTTIFAADWGLFDLKGKVKSVTYSDYNHNYCNNSACPYYWGDWNSTKNKKVSFTKEGKVIIPKGNKIIRNKRGHITDIKFYYYHQAIGEWRWGSQEVRRDSKGRIYSQTGVDTEVSWKTTHSYNSKGYIYKSVEDIFCAEVDGLKCYITYTYQEFDDNGNWTKRSVKRKYNDGTVETHTETRKITYYGTSASKDKKATKSTDSKKSTKSKDSKKSSSKAKSSKSSKK